MAKRKIALVIFIVLWTVLFYQALTQVLGGYIPFWFDPGRDFLLASENLEKIRLIGVPTGIPGVFYLPYWIWMTSLTLLVSRDPRIVTTIMITIPYFFVLPNLFFLLKDAIGRISAISLTLLFLLGYLNLATQFWNPNLAPLFFLALALAITKQGKFSGLLIGILAGFNLAFNMGFGMAVIIATTIYILSRKSLKEIVSYFLGLGIVFLPFMFFETRHGFNQIKSLSEIVIGSKTIGLAGLSKMQILEKFVMIPGAIFNLPWVEGVLLFSLAGIVALEKKFNVKEKRLLIFLFLCLISLFGLYFVAKNPKWDYHFVGVEMIFLLLLGVFLHRTKLEWLLVVLAILVFASQALVPKQFKVSDLDLVEKINVVDTIYEDASGKNFAVRPFNPAIYTYDYDYLFKWMGTEKFKKLPVSETETNTVYLINDPNPDPKKTVKTWTLEGGSTIVKIQDPVQPIDQQLPSKN